MKWSPKQVDALDSVGRWLKSGDSQVFRLFGYAGTGKTTLAKHLVESVSNHNFAAYTGKAASVMRRNGCDNAGTIHQLIYIAAGKSRRRLRELQERLAEARAEQASTAAIARLARELQDPAPSVCSQPAVATPLPLASTLDLGLTFAPMLIRSPPRTPTITLTLPLAATPTSLCVLLLRSSCLLQLR